MQNKKPQIRRIARESRFNGRVEILVLDDALLSSIMVITQMDADSVKSQLESGESIWTEFAVYKMINKSKTPEMIEHETKRLKADIKHIAEQFLDRINEDDFVDETDETNLDPLHCVRAIMIDAYADAFGCEREFVEEILEELNS